MGYGVHVEVPSLSGGAFMASNSTPANHCGRLDIKMDTMAAYMI